MTGPAAHVLDSLRTAIAHRDSLLATLQARMDSLSAVPPDTVVRVAAPAYLPPPRWYETGLFFTLLGGLLGIIAGFGAQWFRGFLDNGKKRAQLKRRILGALGAAFLAARAATKKDETHAIEPRPLRGILVDWQRYERLSDDLGLLGEPPFEDRIDATLGFIRMVAEKVMADEEAFSRTVRETGTVGPKGFTLDADIQNGIYTQRKKLLALVDRMGQEAFSLLTECNKRWPPPPWYQQLAQVQREAVNPEANEGGDVGRGSK